MGSTDPTAYGLCITFPILAVISTVARIIARRRKTPRLALEDWVIVVATILSIANAANVLYGALQANLGQHIPTDKNGLAKLGPKITALQIMTYVTQPVTTIAIGLARWSILLFYARLFAVKSFKIPVRIMYALNGAWTIAFALVYLMECIPVDHLWTQQQGARTGCIDISVHLYFATSGVILDALVLCMPWPMIWRLQMPWARKLGVLGILMLGAIIVGVSIGKTWYFFNIERILLSNHDVTYDEAPLFYWTVPEVCLSVVCANLPMLRPLFQGVSPESVLGSLRSVFSLRSVSNTSNAQRKDYGDSAHLSTWAEHDKEHSAHTPETISLEDQEPQRPASSHIKVNTVVSLKSEPKVPRSAKSEF